MRHDSLLRSIREEFEDEIRELELVESYYINKNGIFEKKLPMFILTISQAKQVLVRESKAVRKAVIKKLEELEKKNQPRQLTTLELLENAVVELKAKEKEILKLNTDLDYLLDYASIIKVANHNKVSELCFNWRLLKAKSIELDLQVKRVPSPRYGYQNLYSIQAFKAVYPEFNYNF